MERILIMLRDVSEGALALYDNALDNACYPQRISLSLQCENDPLPEEVEAFDLLGRVSISREEGAAAQACYGAWQGEEYCLLVQPGTLFAIHWDLALLSAWRKCKDQNAALTGLLPLSGASPDCVSTIGAKGFTPEGALIFGVGTPLSNCRSPQSAAFWNPYFGFGPAAFWNLVKDETDWPVFLTARQYGWRLYTLNDPCLHITSPETVPDMMVCPASPEEKKALQDFEVHFGFRTETRQITPSARLGLFTYNLRYDSRAPLAVKVREHWRYNRLARNKDFPLLVTAYRSFQDGARHPSGETETWFHNLAELVNLSLVCYAKDEMLRHVRLYYPNVYEYKERYSLPLDVLWKPQEDRNQFLLGKLFLIQKAMSTYPTHGWYGWIDFGYQRYTLYKNTAFVWSGLLDAKVHLGWVDGGVDTSLMIVPRDMVAPLCQAIKEEAAASCDNGPLEAEEVIMERIIQNCPNWFTLHELPEKRQLLSLTMARKEEKHD